MSTLDHYSSGRIGWNIVTATSDAAAQNYGYDKQFEHDLRYDMADEYIDLVSQLWEAWEPDAVVMDEATGTFIDPTKVKPCISRQVLQIPRPAQRAPLAAGQAGLRGARRLAPRPQIQWTQRGDRSCRRRQHRGDEGLSRRGSSARDRIRARPQNLQDDVHLRAVHREERERRGEHKQMMAKMREDRLEHSLAAMSFLSGIDFSTFDLDTPLPEIKTNGMQTMLKTFRMPAPTPRSARS